MSLFPSKEYGFYNFSSFLYEEYWPALPYNLLDVLVSVDALASNYNLRGLEQQIFFLLQF